MFNLRKENALLIEEQQGRVIKNPCNERGLYVRERLPLVDCHVCYVAATMVEGYTQCEVERAARARKLYHNLYVENVRNVKVWLRFNQCKNVPILVKDVNLAEKIYKTDVATCNGKL